MKNDLSFDFTVDKEAKTVYITKEFAADLPLVWDAFTRQEILDQWWAPEPFLSRTKYMDFSVGGKRFYAMVTPEGEERWALHTYTSITPKSNFKMMNAFADKDENLQLPGSDWDLSFTEQDGNTKVYIVVKNESLMRLENLLEGFRAGFTMTLHKLGEILSAQSVKQ